MKYNKSLVVSLILGLVVSYIIMLVLCATKVIELNWISAAILFFVTSALLLLVKFGCIKEYIKGKLNEKELNEQKVVEELLFQLKDYFSEIKVLVNKIESCLANIEASGNRMLKLLECQQSVLNKLELKIQQCEDTEAFEVFLGLRNCNREFYCQWQECIKYLGKHYRLQVRLIINYVVNGGKFDSIEYEDDVFDRLEQSLGELSSMQEEFEEDFLPGLGDKKCIIVGLYKDYMSYEMLMLKELSAFMESSMTCVCYGWAIMNCNQKITKVKNALNKCLKEDESMALVDSVVTEYMDQLSLAV